MSAKAIREYHGKKLLSRWLSLYSESVTYNVEDRAVLINSETAIELLTTEYPWLLSTQLVVKPDQLIKRRGKAGLLGINKDWTEVVGWITEKMNKDRKVEIVTGKLDHFIVEPFVPHAQADEYYICIQVSLL